MKSTEKERKLIKHITIVFLVSVIYAIIRYNVFGKVPNSAIPLFVFNKAISMLALYFLGLSFFHSFNQKNKKNTSKYYGLMGLYASWIHIIFSLVNYLLGHYQKLRLPSGHFLNTTGIIAILAGIICTIFLYKIWKMRKTCRINWFQRLNLLAKYSFMAIFIHLLFLGGSSWMNTSNWPGYLPPITLLSVLFVLFILFVLFFYSHLSKNSNPHNSLLINQ